MHVERRKNNGLVVLFIAALLVGMALAANFTFDLRPREESVDGNVVGTNTFTGTTPTAARPADRREPELRLLPILLVLGAGGVTAAYFVAQRRYRLRSRGETTDEQLVVELAALLDDTLDDLRAEPDPRRAVIGAYARMERALAGYGLPRRAFEAPLEYLDRIATELHARIPSARRLVFELTHLFQRAKFSPHLIDAEMKEEAIATLSDLRDELRAEAA